MSLLDDKVAVITGAGSGMGKASVSVFVREGAKVVAADISGAEQDTAADVGGDVLPVHCDVSSEADVEATMAAAVEAFGRVDAVLNVAGIADGCALTELTMEFYDRLMDVDLRGVMLGMKHGVRTMLPTGGGSIINWSSVGGLNGSAFTSVYQAAKHGIIGAGKSAAIEYGTKGIRVNTVCPGFILTEIMAVGARGLHSRHRRQGCPQPRRAAPRGGRGRRLLGL
jgi:NAD(P)-dependent dehydrogenase (short-subunit alcohol dehydrogenase family)